MSSELKQPVPVSAVGGRGELDPFGLWRIDRSDNAELTFNWLAAVGHVFKPYFIGAGVVLFGVPLGLAALLKGQPTAVTAPGSIRVDVVLLIFFAIAFVGIFLPAFVVWTWQAISTYRQGSWLHVDRSRKEIIVRPMSLQVPLTQLQWSCDYIEGYDRGQRSRRSQLLLVMESNGGRQTLVVTARYGCKAHASVQEMARQYAHFTGCQVAIPA